MKTNKEKAIYSFLLIAVIWYISSCFAACNAQEGNPPLFSRSIETPRPELVFIIPDWMDLKPYETQEEATFGIMQQLADQITKLKCDQVNDALILKILNEADERMTYLEAAIDQLIIIIKNQQKQINELKR